MANSQDIKLTPGDWDFACDSYGKVRHSRKACVYTSYPNEKGATMLVTVAARVANWDDARLMAKAKPMLEALKLIADIAEGSGSANSLSNIAKIAREASFIR